jgi:hypothetical protein
MLFSELLQLFIVLRNYKNQYPYEKSIIAIILKTRVNYGQLHNDIFYFYKLHNIHSKVTLNKLYYNTLQEENK